MRKTKIICALGPATDQPNVLKKLLEMGTDVVRLNFSHGDYEEHASRIGLVKKYRAELGLPVAILLDTKGPEIRLGKFKEDRVYLEEGQSFILTTDVCIGDKSCAHISYKEIVEDVYEGCHILIDDGLIELVVDKVVGTKIHCTVINGGFLRELISQEYLSIYPP